MKIKIKALSAEAEIELPDEKEVLNYRSKAFIELIEKLKVSVIEIEKELLNK